MTTEEPPRFGAAVLCGGASRRFGRDKALVEVDGQPMVARVVSSLVEAGAARVILVGGDARAGSVVACRWVADRWPGEGPLGGIITALAEPWDTPVVVVTACDLPDLDPGDVTQLVSLQANSGLDVAVGIDSCGHDQWLLAAWSCSSLPRLAETFEQGVRSPRFAVAGANLDVVRHLVTASSSHDIDSVADLGARPGREPGDER